VSEEEGEEELVEEDLPFSQMNEPIPQRLLYRKEVDGGIICLKNTDDNQHNRLAAPLWSSPVTIHHLPNLSSPCVSPFPLHSSSIASPMPSYHTYLPKGRNYGRAFLLIASVLGVALVLENLWDE